MWFPGATAGSLWSLGNVGSIVAVEHLGQGVGSCRHPFSGEISQESARATPFLPLPGDLPHLIGISGRSYSDGQPGLTKLIQRKVKT